MPSERDERLSGIIEDEDTNNDVSLYSAAQVSKKPKKRSKLKFLFLTALLLSGVVTGMHVGGYIDIRPYIWELSPKIPFIGSYLKEYLDIPEIYTLTVSERRKLELQQWQDRLDAKERELQAIINKSELLSNDIELRQQRINKQEADLLEKENETKVSEITPEEEKLIIELTNTYRDMSPRRAAQIIAQLPNDLAVEMMKKLPQDARASILEKMDPVKAARITENLANP
jgi:flagellar motility protein MotE (MotC chaperone)